VTLKLVRLTQPLRLWEPEALGEIILKAIQLKSYLARKEHHHLAIMYIRAGVTHRRLYIVMRLAQCHNNLSRHHREVPTTANANAFTTVRSMSNNWQQLAMPTPSYAHAVQPCCQQDIRAGVLHGNGCVHTATTANNCQRLAMRGSVQQPCCQQDRRAGVLNGNSCGYTATTANNCQRLAMHGTVQQPCRQQDKTAAAAPVALHPCQLTALRLWHRQRWQHAHAFAAPQPLRAPVSTQKSSLSLAASCLPLCGLLCLLAGRPAPAASSSRSWAPAAVVLLRAWGFSAELLL
jgi:hypothetical protein